MNIERFKQLFIEKYTKYKLIFENKKMSCDYIFYEDKFILICWGTSSKYRAVPFKVDSVLLEDTFWEYLQNHFTDLSEYKEYILLLNDIASLYPNNKWNNINNNYEK